MVNFLIVTRVFPIEICAILTCSLASCPRPHDSSSLTERHVVVDDDKSQADTPELPETSSNETEHLIKPISPHSLDDLRTELVKLWSCVQSKQNAHNSKTLQELDAVKNNNHTLQQEL